MKVTVNDLGGACHEIVIVKADTVNSLLAKVREAMDLPASAVVKLYLSSGGTPIEAGATTLAAQGIDDGAELSVVVPDSKALTDKNIGDAVKRWFDPETRQAVVDEFGEIGDWQVGGVTDMGFLFYKRTEFNEDLSRWDTSRVTIMFGMFEGASSFNQPVGAWDTGKVEDMACMFSGATSFNKRVEKWDTGRVKDMAWMFKNASSFNQPVEAWDTGRVKDMQHMFDGATSFNKRVEMWDTSKVENMYGMFFDTPSFNQRPTWYSKTTTPPV